MYVFHNVLTDSQLQKIQKRLDEADFVDGRTTAGKQAQRVKNNLQLHPSDDNAKLMDSISRVIFYNTEFVRVVQPKSMKRVLISRYRDSMTYGTHTDNSIMNDLRTDVSFTLFLRDPEQYEGGALEIHEGNEVRSYKLPAGSMVVYPSGALHRVTPVTTGYRDAAVGWAQSYIRDPRQREILSDLDWLYHALTEADADKERLNVLNKTRTNLRRLWAEM